jgi:hypothetical protein
MIIGLSGYARSGKDTVADHLISTYDFTRYSFAASMKEAMYRLNPIVHSDDIGPLRYQALVDVYGLDSVKENYPEVRRLLQVFGTEVGRDMFGENFWVDLVLNNLRSFHTVISDVRFTNEADAIRAKGGKIWRVNRKGVGPVTGHSSEINLDWYDFDLIINNDNDIESLNKQIDIAIGGIKN